jgi:hypothetical protein
MKSFNINTKLNELACWSNTIHWPRRLIFGQKPLAFGQSQTWSTNPNGCDTGFWKWSEESKTSKEVENPQVILYLHCKHGFTTSRVVTCSSRAHAFTLP